MTAPGPSVAEVTARFRRRWDLYPARYTFAGLGGFAVLVIGLSLLAMLLGQRAGLLGIAAIAIVGVMALTMRWPFLPILVVLISTPLLLTDLSGGIQVVHVLGAASAVGTLWAVLLRRGAFTGSPILFGGLIFMASLMVSVLVSTSPVIAARVALMYALAVAIGYAVLQGAHERTGAVWIMRAWMVGVVLSIAPHLEAPKPVTVELGGGVVRGRLEGVFTQPNDLGEFCLLSLFVALALWWASDRWFDKVLALSGMGLASVASVLALSRGTFIGIGVGLVVLALLVPRFWRTLLAWVVAGGTLLVVLYLTQNPAVNVLISRLASVTEAENNPSDERGLIWQEAIRLWSNNQWAGVGPGGYLPSSQLGGSLVAPEGAYHAHNILLHIGAEAGIIGIIGLLTAIAIGGVYSLHLIWENAPSVLPRASNAALLAGLVGVAAHGTVDFEYANPVLILLAWIMIGLLASGLRPPPHVHPKGSRVLTRQRAADPVAP